MSRALTLFFDARLGDTRLTIWLRMGTWPSSAGARMGNIRWYASNACLFTLLFESVSRRVSTSKNLVSNGRSVAPPSFSTYDVTSHSDDGTHLHTRMVASIP